MYTFFVPVDVKMNTENQMIASAVSYGGSGDFASLGNSNGFVEIPPSKENHLRGNKVKIYLW